MAVIYLFLKHKYFFKKCLSFNNFILVILKQKFWRLQLYLAVGGQQVADLYEILICYVDM